MKKILFNLFLMSFGAFLGKANAQGNQLSNNSTQNVGSFTLPTSEALSFDGSAEYDESTTLFYGESLRDWASGLSDKTSWTISTLDENKVVSSGMGNSLASYVFNIPGAYLVDINENLIHDANGCDHSHSPEKIFVKVSPLKMEFDFSSVKLSRNIIGGQDTKGTSLVVNVNYSSYDKSIAVYDKTFTTAGIQTSIIGKLKTGEMNLQEGINTLEFELSGQASKNTYIMIDFVDINGVLQSYSLTNKIL